MSLVRDFESCPLREYDPGDPLTGLAPAYVCSRGGRMDCGNHGDAPRVDACPRFEDQDRDGAMCPHCKYEDRDTPLRRESLDTVRSIRGEEHRALACPVCEEGWFESFRDYNQQTQEVMGWLVRERDGEDARGFRRPLAVIQVQGGGAA